ncbi:hypothetical protein KQI52_11515 [bacterium]|nr:hypothetical protein [bacterium]
MASMTEYPGLKPEGKGKQARYILVPGLKSEDVGSVMASMTEYPGLKPEGK